MTSPARRRWAGLVFLLLAGVMDLVDSTVVTIALPSIQRDLGASYSQMQWVAAGYAMAFAVTLISGGRLGDVAGRKRVFLLGSVGFVLASTLCAMAPNAEVLIVARLLQGVLAGLMVPQVLAILTATFEPQERGRAFAIFAGMATLATVGGPPLGAFLTDADLFGLGWRAIFVINVPIGVAAIAGTVAYVPESRSPRGLRPDWVGMAIAAVLMFLLLFPLIQGRERGWPAWTFVALAAAVPALAAFVAYERRKSRQDDSPLVEMTLFRSRSFVGGLLIYLIFMAGVIAFYFVTMIYLQLGLRQSPVRAGLTILPFALGVPVGASLATVLVPRLGRRVLAFGAGALAAAMAGLILTVRAAEADVSVWRLLPALLVAGVGMGLVVTPLFEFVLSEVPVEHAGSASGVLNAVQQVGAAVGVAVLGSVFFSTLGGATDAGAFIDAFGGSLGLQVVVFLVVAALVSLLPRKVVQPDPGQVGDGEPAGGEPVEGRARG